MEEESSPLFGLSSSLITASSPAPDQMKGTLTLYIIMYCNQFQFALMEKDILMVSLLALS